MSDDSLDIETGAEAPPSLAPDGVVHLNAYSEAASTEAATSAMGLTFPRTGLLVVGGPSGAGKSTLCRRLLADITVHSPDSARRELEDSGELDYCSPGRESNIRIFREVSDRASTDLKAGGPAVIDAPALLEHLRPIYPRLARRAAQSPAHLLLITATLDECLSGQGGTDRDYRIVDDGAVRVYYDQTLSLVQTLTETPERILAEGWASVTICSRQRAAELTHIKFV